jgi:hypothetical protein
MEVTVSDMSEWGERRRDPVPGSGERGPRQRGVSRASPCVLPLHAGVQNGTTTGQARWKLPIRLFLQGLPQGCFENRLGHNADLLQATKRTSFGWADAHKDLPRPSDGGVRTGL